MCHQWVKITETTGYKRQAMGLYDSSPANNPTNNQQQQLTQKKVERPENMLGLRFYSGFAFAVFSIFTTQFSII